MSNDGKISGKNINLGMSFQTYSTNKLKNIFSKYTARVVSYKATLEKKKYLFKVKLRVTLINKIEFETVGKAKLANKALDIAVINVGKKIRRYMRKLKTKKISRVEGINFKENVLIDDYEKIVS